MTALLDQLSARADSAAAVLLWVGLRSVLVLSAGWLVARLLRGRSAAIRHLVWLAAVGSVLLLPVFNAASGWRVLPAVRAPALFLNQHPVVPLPPSPAPDRGVAGASVADAAGVGQSAATRPSVSASSVLLAVWLVGVVVCLIPSVAGRLLLVALERRSGRICGAATERILARAKADLGIRRGVTLLCASTDLMPMAWGLFSPRIVLPRDSESWPTAQLRTVLLHELAHIKRHDCLSQLVAQIARAVYWPNPLVWVAARALQTERERACDDLVLGLGTERTDYAEKLLAIAAARRVSSASAAAMAMARPSQLETRIRDILDSSRRRTSMTRTQIAVGAVAAVALVLPVGLLRSAGAQPEPGRAWPPAPVEPAMNQLKPGEKAPWMQSSENIRHIMQAAIEYSQKNGHMPPDLGATFQYMDAPKGLAAGQAAARAKAYLSPADQATTRIPEDPTPEWINANSSYVYLGNAGMSWNDLLVGNIVIVYEPLDRPHLVMYENSVHQLWMVGFADDHVDAINDRAKAEAMIAESRRTLEAIRAGTAAPDDKQVSSDLSQVIHAVVAYAKDHRGHLPPDLGAVLPYVPKSDKHLATAAQRAGVFLSPESRRGITIPDEPTPEWVNAHTNFVYLGNADLRLARIAALYGTILVYADHPYTAPGFGEFIPVARVDTAVEQPLVASAKETIAKSKAVLLATRNGDPLPDLDQALFDTRAIASAVGAYAKAHGGMLPPDLGATLAYIDGDVLFANTPYERAKVYLSPAAERTVGLPAQLTPEWINQHATYVYLGGPGLTMSDLGDSRPQPLIYSPRAEVMHMPPAYGDDPWMAIGFPETNGTGYSMVFPVEQFDEMFSKTIVRLQALKARAAPR